MNMSAFKGAGSVRPHMMMLAIIVVASYIPGMVLCGGVFETAKPIFPKHDDYKLLFKAPPPKGPPPPGGKAAAVIKPAVSPFGTNIIQLAVVTIEPCGIIGAHYHPRGTENQYLVEGQVEVGMFLEDRTTRFVSAKAGEGIVIPQGTLHYVRNTGCKKAKIFVAFDHPTAGAVFAGEGLASFPADYLKSAFGTFHGPTPNIFFSKYCKCDMYSG